MKVENIKKTGKKYKITFDNDLEIKTYDDVIINNGLLYHPEIDPSILNKINVDTNYYDIYYKTINYITRKLRSEKEINEFIDKNNVVSKDKKEVINKLKEIGLINDLNFTKAFISDKIHLSNDGPYKIKKSLLEHNIKEEIIDEELSKIDNELLTEKIKKIINKKIKTSKYNGFILKQKIVNDLTILGYDKSIVIEIFDSIGVNKDINNEYKKLYNKYKDKYAGYELNNKIKSKLYNLGFTIDEINNILM